ncbi:MAG: serine/threonine-protein kinase, partial [Rubrivivax sp.]|nr:serine/threonine-protein kinase [Rubrivivax sp.]
GNAESESHPRQAFLQAARLGRELTHTHIVAIQDAGIEGDQAWLRMEAVPGSDLSRYTRTPRLLPEPLVLKVADKVALALAHAHRQGVVHRDLKPANVLVDWPTDTVKLADFGLARTAGAMQTGTGIVLGTPAYMAPEQLAGALPSAATDLYALGVLLFELLAGRLPHEGRNMGELLQQVAHQPAPQLIGLRSEWPSPQGHQLSALVARLLAKLPSHRPGDAAGVAVELQQLWGDWPG